LEIGHSGGYTALALAGGKPWLPARQQIKVHDPRIKALILMAPAAAYYLPENPWNK
jgi:predicted dienelactone hydrolase